MAEERPTKRRARAPHNPCPSVVAHTGKKIVGERGKGKAKPKELTVGKPGKISGDRKTRRSDPEESLFADGTFLVVTVPEAIKDTITEEDFSNVCAFTDIMKDGISVGALSRLHWFLRYENLDEVHEIVGKEVTFSNELGLKRDMAQEILDYVGDGPRGLFPSSAGPYTDLEIQEMVEKKFSDEKYWTGKKMLGRVQTPKRLLMFEKSQGLYSFELGSRAGFLLRFRAISRAKKCSFCGKEHEGGAGSCPLIQWCSTSSVLLNRLVFLASHCNCVCSYQL
ncbi:unnamed protein product [Blumeria hordei]|uniref:Uncharacterized protein n=1 Tax=Blumeria hordei TaxID=2867405 RepID=A0A383UZA0_BLUHO|nr:unnamed protein product [Blumeria hordei]